MCERVSAARSQILSLARRFVPAILWRSPHAGTVEEQNGWRVGTRTHVKPV